MSIHNSTICAIASPPGTGAISIIRLSGADALSICDKISSKKISNKDTHTLHFCKLIDENEIVDEVLISLFKTPSSYTGEDSIEISCHGSPYIQQRIMELLIKSGAQLAQPGEFTMRAFLNGKLDLSQAEAVADLIHSSSKTGHDAAIHQIRGGFSKEISNLRNQLLQFASLVELELDFSEEDVQFADRNSLNNSVLKINEIIQKLIHSFQYGNVIKNGIPVAIVGKPNVGKSTLLNLLLNEEKAIVSDIPGTTRDVIEDSVTLSGHKFRFIDTAGLRHTNDAIEKLGIERTHDNIKKASIVLLVIDGTDDTQSVIEQIEDMQLTDNQKIAVIINKIDKIELSVLNQIQNELHKTLNYSIIPLSAKKGSNTNNLEEFLLEAIKHKDLSSNDLIVTNIRHFEALQNTLEAGSRLINGIQNQLTGDFLAQDIREMLHHLGTITGEITTDEILGNIFKNFCIGK